jgi:hypothetical protein
MLYPVQIYSDSFLQDAITAEKAYQQVGLGQVEGAVMKALIKKGLFKRSVTIDFQGQCDSGPRFDKVTTAGLPDSLPPRLRDKFVQFRGPIQKQSATFGFVCLFVVKRQATSE